MNTQKTGRLAALATIVLYGVLLIFLEALVYFLIPEEPPAQLAGWPAPSWLKPGLMAAAGALVLVAGILQWRVMARLLRSTETTKTEKKAGKGKGMPSGKASDEEKEKRVHREKKLYLHLLSVLQTEGRLLDFFNENLENYEDAQIGAAVRGVQENCNRALAKYVTCQPVIDQAEGEAVAINPQTDPESYRLSGNVTGQPPFEGVLNHRGWRARSLNIPKFSFSGDPEIIAPASVEIK